jgi:hypothetical protein
LGNFFWRVFLFVGRGSSLFFSFKPLKFSYSVKRKNNVLHERWHKKHDGKNYRRVGVGEANKRQRECRFFCGTAGFYLLWGVLACASYCNG